MQLAARSGVCRHVSRRSAAHSAPVAVHGRPHQQRRAVFVVRAAEGPDPSDGAQTTASSDDVAPLERAKLALEAEVLDKDLMATCIAGLEAEMASLRGAVSSAEAKVASLDTTTSAAKDQYLRLTADFDNFRRRSRDEAAQTADNVKSEVVKDLLPLLDNFELARNNVKAETEGEQKINNSYQSLYKQMVDALRTLGVEPVPTTGTPFDPAIHDAIMREPSADHPDGTVLQEFRKGFVLKERLLRPAMVKVSFSDEPAASSEE